MNVDHKVDKKSASEASWLINIQQAPRTYFVIKLFGITLFISLFFVAYFYVLNHPAYPITVIRQTEIDHLISFQPLALVAYLSLWLYVALPPALIVQRQALYGYVMDIALLCVSGLTIFYFWPTAISVSDINWDLYPNIHFLKQIDLSGNACPSMHVATALFSGVWLYRLLRQFYAPVWVLIVNAVWCLTIIYSTIAIRQHVALDVLGGVALCIVVLMITSTKQWKKLIHWRK